MYFSEIKYNKCLLPLRTSCQVSKVLSEVHNPLAAIKVTDYLNSKTNDFRLSMDK